MDQAKIEKGKKGEGGLFPQRITDALFIVKWELG